MIKTGRWNGRTQQRLLGAVVARDGTGCWLCGEPVSPRSASLDHVQPVSRGGDDNLANLRLAHRRCNYKRGNRIAGVPVTTTLVESGLSARWITSNDRNEGGAA